MALLITLLPLLFTGCLSRDIFMAQTSSDTITENEMSCEFGWLANGYYCYKVQSREDKLPWLEAAEYCAALGGSLASIHSPEENEFLTNLLVEKLRVFTWIGLQDINEESDFRWQDETLLDYENWANGEPSGDKFGDEDCVGMSFELELFRIGNWNDANCDESHSFICKKPRGPEITPSNTPQLRATEINLDSVQPKPAGDTTSENDYPKVMIYENLGSLINASADIDVGTVAFLTNDQSLLVRVRKGWKYLQMSKLIHVPEAEKRTASMKVEIQQTTEEKETIMDNISNTAETSVDEEIAESIEETIMVKVGYKDIGEDLVEKYENVMLNETEETEGRLEFSEDFMKSVEEYK